MKKGKTTKKSKDTSKGMLLNDKEMSNFLLNLSRDVINDRKKVAENLKEMVKLKTLDERDTVAFAIDLLSRDITPQQYLDEVNAKLDKEEKENL